VRTIDERLAARRLSEHIDAMRPRPGTEESDDLLDVVSQLSRLGERLGPPALDFEQRLMARIEARLSETSRRPRLAWAMVLVVALLVVGLFISSGQAALARLMAVFQLGQTQVRLEPGATELARLYPTTAEATLASLAEAQSMVAPRILMTPIDLPSGYRLHRVSTSYFDDLPDWVQPLFIDVTYRREISEVVWELAYRQYFVAPGGPGTIRALTYPPEEFESVQDMSVAGRPAVLMSREPSESTLPGERLLHLVWEGEQAIFTLTALDLTPDEIIRVAESVAPYR